MRKFRGQNLVNMIKKYQLQTEGVQCLISPETITNQIGIFVENDDVLYTKPFLDGEEYRQLIL